MMRRSYYRTKHRSLILRTVKNKTLIVKLIYLEIKASFATGELKRLPALNQIHRTVSDLLKGHFIIADISEDKKGRGTYYNGDHYNTNPKLSDSPMPKITVGYFCAAVILD